MKLTTAWSTAAVLLLALVACTGSVEEEAPATASIPATAIAVVSTTTPVLPPCSGPADRDSPISNVNAHADADDRSSSDSHACSAYSHPSTDGHPAADGDAHTGTHAYSVTHCHPNAAAQPGLEPQRRQQVLAAATLLETATPPNMIEIIEKYKATISFTAPTAYRAMLAAMDEGADLSSLRIAVSAGETLPAPVFEAWTKKTGKPILDGIGSTELLHIFITNRLDDMHAATTGRPVTGYEAKIVDDAMNEVPRGTIGKLAVRGPTGCRYLADDRQGEYVKAGWNITGDAFVQDEDGRFHFAARADDIIVSAGYNIAGPEVEAALLAHADVAECAVIGVADEARGQIVQAHVVLGAGCVGDATMTKRLQDHVKATIAPYKYPRSIVFTEALPKTQTGKIQRFRLREDATA